MTDISRSEKKRQAKRIEELSRELSKLSDSEINRLPCDDFLKEEIKLVRTLKTGALKRQIKFIAKELRQQSPEALFDYMEEQKGSKLKQSNEFHELERLRDSIVTEALNAFRIARRDETSEIDFDSHSASVADALEHLPDLDTKAVVTAALRFARSRKPVYNREIFRLLKAASERARLQAE